MSSPLTLAEQYGCTTSLSHEFALAAREVIGGALTLLVATDPRLLAQQDHALDMPMDLHVFLTLPDGSVVDAKGLQSLTALLKAWGVEEGYTHHLVKDPDGSQSESSFGAASKRLTQVLKSRLEELDWLQGAPPADTALPNKKEVAAAQKAWTKVRAHYQSQLGKPPPFVHSPARKLTF